MEYIKVLLPSIGVALIFWYVMRAVVRSDSIERREMDRYYAEIADVKAAGKPVPRAASAPAERDGADGQGDETRSD
jgi:hypothetical protein